MVSVFGKNIAIDSEILGGTPCVKGRRYPVSQLLAQIADGQSLKTIAGDFDLNENDLVAVFEDLETYFNRSFDYGKRDSSMRLDRKPVFLNDTTVVLFSILKSTNDFIDMWLHDYVDYYKQQEVAAKTFIEEIEDECSIRFLQCLRKALAEKIDEWNTTNGTNHKHDLD